MIEHLKLHPKRAFAGGTINGLGKITVFCGKNNSGKSTILEAIFDKSTSVGKKLTTDQINKYAKDSANMSAIPYFNITHIFEEHVKSTLLKQEVWYASEKDLFYTGLRKVPNELQSYSFQVPVGAFEGFFTDKIDPALITAKRKLETIAHTNVTGVNFDAVGILAQLYWLKNQSPGTPERQSFDEILEAFKKLSDGFLFNITQEKQSNIHLVFSSDNRTWHDAQYCGLGLHELLIVLYFCHASEHNLILIEELENHLHPHMQKKLLRHLCGVEGKQFVISTHSSAFLDTSLVERIFYVSNSGNVETQEVTSRAEVLKNLGYSISDNIVSDLIILVEGPSDTPVIEEFLVKKQLLPAFDIKIWPLGGDIMNSLDLEVFKQNFKTMALIDNDPGSKKVRKEFLTRCEELQIPAMRLERYGMENYFSLQALKAVFPNQIPSSIQAIDPAIKLEDQIGFNVKASNRKIAKAMSFDEIQGTDLERFLTNVEKECRDKT